jgi:hypothetical protein
MASTAQRFRCPPSYQRRIWLMGQAWDAGALLQVSARRGVVWREQLIEYAAELAPRWQQRRRKGYPARI